ncbi:pentapeptide repeat-containing protein [Lachnospiraceae bacterium 38-10]
MCEKIKGYKVFNADWTCRGFQYEVGKIFEEDVIPSCCDCGFHFCLKASDCFNYYKFSSDNKVAEVIALGDVDYADDNTKCCTNRIHIVREIPWDEVLRIVNTGKDCTGLCNTGNRNTGDWNTGDCNTGNCNTGDCNTGNRNTGDWNTGDRNTGNWNTGDWNTGDWNRSSFNAGCFNTEEQKITMFNKPSDWSYRNWLNSDARYLLNQIPKNVVEWVYSEDMTDEEKAEHPTHETTGGYLKVLDESECVQLWWDGLREQHREIISSLPNFDPDIFEQCTGIKVQKEGETGA